MTNLSAVGQKPMEGGLWKDTSGNHINAHGGNIIQYRGTYYWYGETRSNGGPVSSLGVSCYTSKNLRDWTSRGLVLSVTDETNSDIQRGCIIERPKVVFNARTRKFVMWFHLELKGRGYEAARAAVAVSDNPLAPSAALSRVADLVDTGMAETD